MKGNQVPSGTRSRSFRDSIAKMDLRNKVKANGLILFSISTLKVQNIINTSAISFQDD